ncbi:hypothetical protein [Streptomyces sp. NPDC015131]|uniref:hypothetical protein n=1 Tax=Streptomyces sp. NPDC015131 TaxID=3364941 RepID=UPI0036FBAFCC
MQVLAGGGLRWDVESACAVCGFALAACGGDMPDARRRQMLAEHGPTRLEVSGPSTQDGVTVMRVVRAELGVDLAGAKAVARRVLNGGYSGTYPEVELLARALRACGINASAVRPEGLDAELWRATPRGQGGGQNERLG